MNANLKKGLSLSLILAAAAAAAVLGFRHWRHGQLFVATDDAYVKGHVVAVASRVPGKLLRVELQENQRVQAGQEIAALDPQDFDMALAKARASVAEAENGLALAGAQIAQAEAQVRAAQSQLELARIEKDRISALYQRDSIPRQKLDQVVSAEQVAAAQVTAALRQVAAARAGRGVGQSKLASSRASAEQAALARSYCAITAPSDGWITRKLAEPGMVVAPGQPLLAVVPLGPQELWVEANFKETQLKRVRPGQPAELRLDLDDGRVFQGTVDSIAAGTGAAFSLLPAENATGNWVKVVQRVPVKIRLQPGGDPDHRLRLGLSVQVAIDTRDGRNAQGRP
jgi:membrane fusion protein (multidrug efflux system)